MFFFSVNSQRLICTSQKVSDLQRLLFTIMFVIDKYNVDYINILFTKII